MITKEQLIEYGFTEITGETKIIFPFEKAIDEDLTLCVTMLRNEPEFCIQTPDGILYFRFENLDQLRTVERSLAGYEQN